jgi:streptomycin 6-kinase
VTELAIPPKFTEHVHRALAPDATRWLSKVPALAAEYTRKWDLEFEGEAMFGFVSVVQPARRADGTPVALKIGWPHEESADEPRALSTWAGRGAVLLLESAPDDGVLLLERLDATRDLGAEPLDSALTIAARLARRLAVPAPPMTRSVRAEAERLGVELPRRWAALGEPFGRRCVDAAAEVCRDLGPEAGEELVNEDLHFENVLAGQREPWLVIDPKPLAGDVEWGVLPLLWNRFDKSTLDGRLDLIVAEAGLDPERARAWTLVRAAGNWLRSLEDSGSADRLAPMPLIAQWAAKASRPRTATRPRVAEPGGT